MASNRKTEHRRGQKARATANNNTKAGALLFDGVKNHTALSLPFVVSLVKSHPALVRELDPEGSLPLHYACSRGAPLSLVKLLVERYPQALQVANQFKALPLHYACHCGASSEVLKLLVNAYPAALGQKGFFGNLPLHLLVASQHNRNINQEEILEAIKLLIEVYPQALQVANDDDMLPLQHCWMHQGIGGNLETYGDRLVYLVEKYPQALLHEYTCGAHSSTKRTLLHNELKFRHTCGGPWDGLRFLLLQLYYPSEDNPFIQPNSTQPEPCRFVIGNLTMEGPRQLELLKVLLECIPRKARIAAASQEDESIVKLALRKSFHGDDTRIQMIQLITSNIGPDELNRCDSKGRHVLYYAIENVLLAKADQAEQEEAVFQLIIQRCDSQATSTPDHEGCLALHWVFSHRIRNRESDAPKWYAPTPPAMVRTLLQENPRALFQATNKGFYPIQLAALGSASVECLYLLLQADPTQLTRCVVSSKSWHLFLYHTG